MVSKGLQYSCKQKINNNLFHVFFSSFLKIPAYPSGGDFLHRAQRDAKTIAQRLCRNWSPAKAGAYEGHRPDPFLMPVMPRNAKTIPPTTKFHQKTPAVFQRRSHRRSFLFSRKSLSPFDQIHWPTRCIIPFRNHEKGSVSCDTRTKDFWLP